MIGYIYLTTNLIDGKMYIGKHCRPQFDPYYKGSGKLLWRAINKYGWDNFKVEVLKECDTRDELNINEKFYIQKYRTYYGKANLYNIALGGDGGDIYSQLDDEGKYSMTRSFRENQKELGLARRGLRFTDEHRMKIRITQLGESNSFYGKSHSDESRKKMSESTKRSYIKNKSHYYLDMKLDATGEVRSVYKAHKSTYLKNGWVLV